MNGKVIAVIILLSLSVVTVGYAYTEANLERSNTGNNISPATENAPLFGIGEEPRYDGGTNGQDFLLLSNNYDETLTVTVTLGNGKWNFPDGTTSNTYTVQQDGSLQTEINIGGKGGSCDKVRTYSYTYSADSTSLSVQDTTNEVDVCFAQGNNGGRNSAPSILELRGFGVDNANNEFTIDQVQVDDVDSNLGTATYTVRDGSGNIVGSISRSLSGGSYQEQNIKISSSQNIVSGETYELTLEVTDQQSATASAKRTASVNADPITINTFDVSTVGNSGKINIDQVQIQDSDGDLSSATFRVIDSSGSIVYEEVRTISGQQYQEQGIRINSNNIQKQSSYTVRVIGEDSDGDQAIDDVTIQT